MNHALAAAVSQVPGREARLIWTLPLWPINDRQIWVQARARKGSDGRDNPAVAWRDRTLKKNEDGYGRYLSWLGQNGLLIEDEAINDRITPARIASYIASLNPQISPVGVAAMVGVLTAAARALRPAADWSWLSRRSTHLKLKAKPSREKRHAMRHTLDLYRYGKHVMDTADQGKGKTVAAAQRYQSGLVIALLAARPLRITNFQAVTIGESLRWDGTRCRLSPRPLTADLCEHPFAVISRFVVGNQHWSRGRPALASPSRRISAMSPCSSARNPFLASVSGVSTIH